MLLTRHEAESDECLREEIRLLGQPHLSDYLDFVKTRVVGGADIPRKLLVDEWRVANDHYYELEKTEAGIADTIGCDPLDATLEPLALEILKDPRRSRSLETLPTRIGMVELGRLIVYQTFVSRQFSEGLTLKLKPDPDPESLFRFCLPTEREQPPVRIQRLGPQRYLFSSESNDLRPHSAVLLEPDRINDYDRAGTSAGLLALGVGFSSNFLTAIRSGRRMLLHNGYHRAHALLAAGITHAPCLIQEVTRRDELRAVAVEQVCADPEFYFAAARPPLLGDFFNPALSKILPVLPMRTMVEVEFTVRKYTATG